MTQTPITEERAALVGRRWQGKGGCVRFYVNGWARLAGLRVGDARPVGEVWIADGRVHSTVDWTGAGLPDPNLPALVAAEIARRAGVPA